MFGDAGTERRWLPLDYPLWDLAARRAGVPVYQLANGGAPAPPEPEQCANCALLRHFAFFRNLSEGASQKKSPRWRRREPGMATAPSKSKSDEALGGWDQPRAWTATSP